MYQNFIGIDISKNDFSAIAYDQKKAKFYSNTQSGMAEFFSEYKEKLGNGLVILETTGGYELDLIRFLQQRNCAVHRANARKVKHFIRSFGKLGKSDAIDAAGLAQYGYERHSTLELFEENTRQKLLKLVQRRIELKKMLVQEKNRRQAPGQDGLKKSFDTIIAVVESEIKAIDLDIDAACKADDLLEKQKQALKTIEGIGDITAMQLLALLPELGIINRRKIASLAGLAPHPNESGKKTGYRSTRGGRADIKPILFMAAMTAARSKSRLGEFYMHLVAAGKKKMVALTALMRKILVIANARLRDLGNLNQTPQHG